MKASEAGPIPAPELTAVLSLRDIDGRDIWPALYRTKDGEYVTTKCRDGVPIGPVTGKLTMQGAFKLYRKLLARVRPGMDVWRCGESRLLEDVAEAVPADPQEAGEELGVCVQEGFGPMDGHGIFTDFRGRFFSGVRREDGGIESLRRVTIGEALREAAQITDRCTDAEIGELYLLLKASADRMESIEKRRGVELRVELAATTERSLRRAAEREGVNVEEFAKQALARNCGTLTTNRLAGMAGN